MLSWPAGPRPTDGIWAKYWYANVWASTGFSERSTASGRSEPAVLPPELEPLAARCQPFYEEMAAHRLIPR
jgi:hypothetical protein